MRFAGRVSSAIQRAANKARGRSFAELRERGEQFMAAALERRGLSGAHGEPTDAAFWRDVDPALAAEVGRDFDRLHARFLGQTSPHFFFGAEHADATVQYLNDSAPDVAAKVVAAANRVRNGAFDLLGYEALRFGAPVDWHLDPTTGIRSPRSHWSQIRYLDPSVVGDHKVVWELNRHQHFMVLGRAYRLTGNEEYAQTFVDHVTAWMNDNPPKQGINWASSLEVSYRLIAWLWAIELFRKSPKLTAKLRGRMLKYLHAHATHIERFLSTYFSPNTHLTGEALGLWYAGTMLREFRDAARWARLGWDILAEQLFRQVHPDGVYFEQATYYQRYTADIYLHAVLLARLNGHTVPDLMLQRIDALVGHLADLTRPDGSIPLIGDDDGGKLVALEERSCADARAVLATAAVVLDRPKYALAAGCAPEETLWLLGSESAHALRAMRAKAPVGGSQAFESGGIVVMRDGWDATANHAVIDSGPHGTLNCGHAHADALSIELTANGQPLLVDPGTFSYTASAHDRDHFRHSAAHNTLTVDDAASSVVSGPFAWETRTDAQIDTWWTSDSVDYFSGSHRGFERIEPGAVHRRRILFVKKGYWVIWDSIQALQQHTFDVYFHTAPGTEIVSADSRQVWLEHGQAKTRERALLATFGTADHVELTSDWVSPCYGARVSAPVCRLSATASGRQDFISVVVPSSPPTGPRVEEVEAAGGYAIVIQLPNAVDVVTLRTGDSLSTESVSTDAEMTWSRRPNLSAGVTALAVLAGRSMQSGDVSLDSANRGSAEAQRMPDAWRVLKGNHRVSSRDAASADPAAPVR